MGRFTASFGAGKGLLAAKKVWQEKLKLFTDKELVLAADDAVDFPSEKIFTLGEFKKICEAVRRRNARTGLPAYTGSSDMSNEQWKHWFKHRFGVEPVIYSTPRRQHV